MRVVRVWIKKEGRAKYISHLDLNRCFLRAVRRAGIGVWYTEGFNPRPHLNFLTPLPLGQESECEILEIKLEKDMKNKEIKSRLSAVLPEGISIRDVTNPVDDPSLIAMAEYSAEIETKDAESAERFCERSKEIIEGKELFAEKPGKKGGRKVLKKINVCDHTVKFDISPSGNNCMLSLILTAGRENNLNPDLLLSALIKECETEAEILNIRKKRILKSDFSIFR
ncbi:MAG: TIGR03936 family radical SAM-associated protein [Clostridiales bacterium]|nr:TIGR03936 family radical SAM-associated protein [Clostridiales bacterium]